MTRAETGLERIKDGCFIPENLELFSNNPLNYLTKEQQVGAPVLGFLMSGQSTYLFITFVKFVGKTR